MVDVGIELARAHFDCGTRVVYANVWRMRNSPMCAFIGDPHASREDAEAALAKAPACYFVPYRVRVRMRVRP
ncbi:hypothetical protein [Shinella kummerowiae]|uniref:hypothetical protein n=1 Tax=Shinella kummerowiae TaxID=417745 RepID=UPI0021B58608|nr:hypothetical protein [Shinella kummerowiae]MCT7662348.1 hypothetical protein [Shinella kummerowiae]